MTYKTNFFHTTRYYHFDPFSSRPSAVYPTAAVTVSSLLYVILSCSILELPESLQGTAKYGTRKEFAAPIYGRQILARGQPQLVMLGLGLALRPQSCGLGFEGQPICSQPYNSAPITPLQGAPVQKSNRL